MSVISGTNPTQKRDVAWPRTDSTAIVLNVAALSSVIMFQALRVLVSYLVVVVGQANRSALIRDTLAIFLAMAAAPVLIRIVGLRRTVIATATVIAVLRVTLQFWTQADARLMLAAAILVFWGWLTIALIQTDRRAVSFGLLAGMILDVAIRVAFLTMDLPWNTSIASGAVTVVIAALLLVGALLSRSAAESGEATPGANLALIAIGPGLATFHLVGCNLGLAQTKTGLGFAGAASVLGLGLAAGLIGSTLAIRYRSSASLTAGLTVQLLVTVVGGSALWVFWTRENLAPYALPLIVAAIMMLVSGAIWSDTPPSGQRRIVVPTIWFTLGMLIQVGILFYYYDASGHALYMVIAAVALAIGSLFGSFSVSRERHHFTLSTSTAFIVVIPVLLLVIACAWQFVGVSNPTADATFPATFTVMTYNLQDGFAANNTFDLEAQAAVIESAHPDVVVLQEVSRGWLVTSGADEALWLSHRLNMPIYFGGNSDDGLWGNAILTRAPVSNVRQLHFTVTKNLKRGTIEVQVPTPAGNIWFVGTHLDNPKAADDIRLEQTRQLISALEDRYPAVVMGDFNADPGTDVLNTFNTAGLTDPGLTFISERHDNHR